MIAGNTGKHEKTRNRKNWNWESAKHDSWKNMKTGKTRIGSHFAQPASQPAKHTIVDRPYHAYILVT